jgi:hypothetical protein
MSSWLAAPEIGALLLAKFSWLDDIYHKFGCQVGDQSIQILSDKRLKKSPKSFIARI